MSMTNFPNGLPGGVSLYGQVAGPGTSGSTYFVDGNSGHDGHNGTSWEDAFKTLAVAFAASHADIARGYDRFARRNTIYICGDWFTETLVAFPQKTDVIGVGSADGFKGAGITGLTAPINTAIGTRFFNVNFRSVGAGTLMTLTNACTGVEFHGCSFHGNGYTSAATTAIDATASNFLKVINCDFTGAFTGDVIDIGAGAVDETVIQGNRIIGGANDGIVETATATITGVRRGLIADNYISVAARPLVTNATSVFDVINNRLISAVALTTTADVYVIDLSFASGNLVTGNGVQVRVPAIA